MKRKSIVALAAAILLTGAGLYATEAGGHGGGGGHSHGGMRGGVYGRMYGMDSRSFSGRNSSPQFEAYNKFAGTIPAGGLVYTLGLKKAQQLKQASFSKANLFYEKRVSGRDWYKDHRWDKDYDWRRGHDGHWYGYRWYRHVFWPYFSGDLFCFEFWPDYCYDVFWGYGPDVILWDSFWPDTEFNNDDAIYAGDIYAPFYGRQTAKAEPQANTFADSCAGLAPGVDSFPVEKFEAVVEADAEQRNALSDLKNAVAKAADVLNKSCPSEAPLTPAARLDAMEQRLRAMVEANELVKDPSVRLYTLLTDAQKWRLHALSGVSAGRPLAARTKELNLTGLCSSQAAFTAVPAEQIAKRIALTNAQKQELEKLKAASAKASGDVAKSCPTSIPDTPGGRIDAAQKRLSALIEAVNTLRPAVRDFYASLTDEQKAALSRQPKQQALGASRHSLF